MTNETNTEEGDGLPLTKLTCSPVSRLEHRNGRDYLRFQPRGYEFPILLPVITHGSRAAANAWTWNGSIDKPTLKPSVKTTHPDGTVSHTWLTDGMCQHLSDSTDGLVGQTLPLVPLANVEVSRRVDDQES